MPKQKQKQLVKKIEKSFILREDLRDKLLANLDNLSPEDLALVKFMFDEADKTQNKLVNKMVKYDDAFAADVKHFIESEKSGYAQKKEKEHRKDENSEDLLKKIQ
jgi:hypothetical protein